MLTDALASSNALRVCQGRPSQDAGREVCSQVECTMAAMAATAATSTVAASLLITLIGPTLFQVCLVLDVPSCVHLSLYSLSLSLSLSLFLSLSVCGVRMTAHVYSIQDHRPFLPVLLSDQ